MESIILESVWHLRTDPFYPEVDAQGTALPKNAIEQSLNPLIDDRVVPLYFDVYDWTSSDLVRELSRQNALAIFPTPRTLPRDAAVMLLISGPRQTGLDSLANLLVHKVKVTAGHMPLIADLELDGRDKARNIASVAKRIVTKLKFERPATHPDAASIAKQMEEEYERSKKEEEGHKDATYSDLFVTFRDLLAGLGRQVVLKITGGGDNDNWVRIYDSVKNCCSYVIVMTSDFAYAKTAYNAMIALNRNVAWIRAVPLNRARAGQFLADRLAAARASGVSLPNAERLLPFTTEAVDALYEPGSASTGTEPLLHPVGWLRRTFDQALTDQLTLIANAQASVPGWTVAAIDPADTRIGAAEMRKARETLNRRA